MYSKGPKRVRRRLAHSSSNCLQPYTARKFSPVESSLLHRGWTMVNIVTSSPYASAGLTTAKTTDRTSHRRLLPPRFGVISVCRLLEAPGKRGRGPRHAGVDGQCHPELAGHASEAKVGEKASEETTPSSRLAVKQRCWFSILKTRMLLIRNGSNRAQKAIVKPACEQCNDDESPRWRNGPGGPRTLCNVCGLLYKKRLSSITQRRHIEVQEIA